MFNNSFFRKITSTGMLAFLAASSWATTTETALAKGKGSIDVSVELMLSIDVSGSVDKKEYNLQMDGYAAAFRDNEVISTIESLPEGLAVGVQFWSARPDKAKSWRLIKTRKESLKFADYLDKLSRPSKKTTSIYTWKNKKQKIGGGTNITGAISAATASITSNKFNGDTLVIDVSGDGYSNGFQYNATNKHLGTCETNSSCSGVKKARDAAEALGITINGLPIDYNSKSTFITDYYTNNIKTSNGFIESASGFDDFTRAAKKKIYREISAVFTPDAAADTITTDEDTHVIYNLINGDPNNGNAGKDTDPNGDSLTLKQFTIGSTTYQFTKTTTSIDATLNSGAKITVWKDGKVKYDPNGKFESLEPGDTRTESLTYTVQDPSGYADTATATFDVNGVADNPVAQDDQFSGDEDSIQSLAVLANDDDPNTERKNLYISNIKGIAVKKNDSITLNSGATLLVKKVDSGSDTTGAFVLEYDPTVSTSINFLNEGETYQETFTYTVSDPEGNTDEGSVTITVTGIDDTFPD